MRYAFLVLMCVFAILYESVKEKGTWAARLTTVSLADVMLVLIAVAGRIGASGTYYALVLIGLCLSLAGDIIRELFGGKAMLAVNLVYLSVHFFYIAAFFSYAPPAWYDAVLFTAFLSIGFVCFWAGKNKNKTVIVYLYTVVLCAMAAKAASMLFVKHTREIYAAFAASGGVIFTLSDAAQSYSHSCVDGGRPYSILSTALYYGGQALIALSIGI